MKLMVTLLMMFYLGTLAFGIFLTDVFRIPAPFLFCFPLVFLFREKGAVQFLYARELILLCIALFFYYVIGLSEVNSFAANILCIMICAFYFNYFVGNSERRFNASVWIFFGLLFFSSVVMVLNHFYGEMDTLRELIMGDRILQSPAGIALSQFAYGYQLAALIPFAFICTCAFKTPLLVKGIALGTCLLFVFLGMQRSVFVGFVGATFLFLALYYRFRAVLVIVLMVLVCGLLYNYVLKDNLDTYNNILVKNNHNDAAYNRSSLAEENLRIYTDYPYGLIFYGKNWSDVIYRDYVFSSGITSHNAYLIFFTYLGPFLGLGLLAAIYYRVGSACRYVFYHLRKPENAMLACLCFSFIGVSVNALSHNPWLISADGPTVFLYFSILHLYQRQKQAHV